MRSLFVVPADPLPDRPTCLREVGEHVLPDALPLQGPEEPFDHAVLFRGVGGDELLTEAVVPKRGPEATTLEDESVVTSHDGGRSLRPKRPETGDAGSSRARSASLARPRRANSYPTISPSCRCPAGLSGCSH